MSDGSYGYFIGLKFDFNYQMEFVFSAIAGK
jgi:hypothetical protein